MRFGTLGICLVLFMTGCGHNPVTGQTELNLVSTTKEIKMGNEYYGFGQQNGGGRFKLDPALTAYVQEVGQKLVKESDRATLPYEFVVLNDSTPNAWALPGGKISINRGLLVELNNEAELASVLGHEITHAAARHGAKAIERQILLTTGLIVTSVAIASTIKNPDKHHLKQNALLAGAGVAAGLISKRYSREAELEADAYGMKYMSKAGYSPMAAVRLQELFIRLANGKSSNWLKGLFETHPPSTERLKANQIYAANLPQGELFTERYQSKIAFLKKTLPAYKAYDEGLKALKSKDLSLALTNANKAIQLENKEALFYGVKADILSKENVNNPQAISLYNKAIELDSDYFYYYHQRGTLLAKLGKRHEAKKDLERSQQLLPTESAAELLTSLS